LGHGEDMQAIYQKPKDLKMKDLAGIPWRVAYALQADGWYLRSDCPWLKANAMPESIQDRPAKATENIFLLSKKERYYFDPEAVRKPGKEWAGQAGTFARKNGKMNGLDVPGQSRVSHRENREDRVPAGRNRRNTDWFYESLDEAIVHLAAIRDSGGMLLSEEAPEALLVNPAAYKAAHFATFPPKLIEPMILASTSDYGVCGDCGSPWQRVIERKAESQERPQKVTKNGIMLPDGARIRHGLGKSTLSNTDSVEKTTTGWRPSCSCDSSTVPAVVLDPFGGSGTTGKVTLANRRNFILIDANPTYATELATERLNGTQIKLMEAA
jgi:DNA modification methylase